MVGFGTGDCIVSIWFSFILVSIVGVKDLESFELCKIYGVFISVSRIVSLVGLDWFKGPVVIEFSSTKLIVRLSIVVSCIMRS